MKLSVIVPCYNESENVTKLYNELLPVIRNIVDSGRINSEFEVTSTELIFVDDGSNDFTTDKLVDRFGGESTDRLTIRFLRHEINLGLGAAIRTGLSNAIGDILLTADSDGTYRFSDIPGMLALLTAGIDIVTASPYHPDGMVAGVPASRLILSRGSSFIYRILVDWHVYTYTCLFRAYRAEVVRDISFEANDFLGGTELLVKAILRGYRVAEFPAVLFKRQYGVSKAKIARTVMSHLGFQWKVLAQKILVNFGIKPMQSFKKKAS